MTNAHNDVLDVRGGGLRRVSSGLATTGGPSGFDGHNILITYAYNMNSVGLSPFESYGRVKIYRLPSK